MFYCLVPIKPKNQHVGVCLSQVFPALFGANVPTRIIKPQITHTVGNNQ